MNANPPPVIVVGAGIVGLCTAFHLQRMGTSVLVIDRGPPGGECSAGNAGSVSPGSVVPLGMPGILRSAPQMLLDPESPLRVPFSYLPRAMPWLLRFALASSSNAANSIADALAPVMSSAIDDHRTILADIGGMNLLRTTGQLQLYPNAKSLVKDQAGWDMRRRHGVRFENISRDDIHDLEPNVSAAYERGVYLPDYGMITNPLRYSQLLAQVLAHRGAKFVIDDIVALEVLAAGGVDVVGRAARYHGTQAVVCAGAWSQKLLAGLGYQISLETQRGYHVTLAVDPAISRPVVAADSKVFASPMETGLRLAGTVEFGGFERPPTPQRFALLLKQGQRMFPKLDITSARTEWMGHRPCCPDSLPVLGPSRRHKGLWFNFGHGHLGLTMSAPSARMIAQAMQTRANQPSDLAAYDAERFGWRSYKPAR